MPKISIYTFKLAENYSKLPPTMTFLDAIDQKKLANISNDKRRQEFLVTRYITKRIFTDIYHLKHPKFTYNSKGKPKVRGLKFNWTHSDNQAILAVSKDSEVGIDLEIGKRSKSIDKISKTFFSPEEYRYIFAVKTEKQQMLRFQKLWSLKEAFAKAIGRKLNKKTIQIHFDLKTKKVVRLPLQNKVSFFIHATRALALCVLGSTHKLEFSSVRLRGKTLFVKQQTRQGLLKLS